MLLTNWSWGYSSVDICFPARRRCLHRPSTPYKPDAVVYACNPSKGKVEVEDQDFKISLSSIRSSWPSWAMGDCLPKQNKTKQKTIFKSSEHGQIQESVLFSVGVVLIRSNFGLFKLGPCSPVADGDAQVRTQQA